MNIVDRLLNGEFDDNDDVSIQSTRTSSVRGEKGTFAKPDPAPKPEPEEDEEEDISDEEWDESDWEVDVESDIEDGAVVLHDPDVPSEEYCKNIMASMDPDTVSEPELAGTPKNSEFKKPKKTMSTTPQKTTPAKTVTPTPTQADASATPKNSTAENTKPGRPAKLSAHTDEVVRLYNEGLSAKGIADQYSVSISCVFNCLKAAGVAIRPRGRRKTK